MNNKNLNQQNWLKLFEKHRILASLNSAPFFLITAENIKEFREPRLMTKFDHEYLLPNIFKENDLAILPLTRGSYAIGRFKIFHTLEMERIEVESLSLTSNFESLNFDKITSESTAISCAYVSKILEDFLGEEITPTISGRMSSDRFEFKILNSHNSKVSLKVDRAQIEIDAGFESQESLTLIEAKNHFSDDLLIRQLYYPYRKWKGLIRKPIRNLFLTYSDGIYEIREYIFLQSNNYNSINLIKHKKYAICDFQINTLSLRKMLSEVTAESEPFNVPFPQADSFDRVINLCELINNDGILTKSEITENYGFTSRQTDYYLSACKYLDLVEPSKDGFILTKKVQDIFKQHIQLRRKFFIEQIIKRRVFKTALDLYLSQASMPSNNQLLTIMQNFELRNINSYITRKRRASTVRSWIDWIVAQIEE